MESFMKELCEIKKMRSSLCPTKQTEQNSLEEHKRTESLSEKITVAVEQEFRVEANKRDGKHNNSADYSKDSQHGATPPNRNYAMWSDDDGSDRSSRIVVSTLRTRYDEENHYRSRSKARDGTRSYETSEKRHRSNDRSGRRRSRSRSKHQRDYSTDRKSERSRSRSRRRQYSADGEGGRSGSRSRRREYYTDREGGRSESRGRRRQKYPADKEGGEKSGSRSRYRCGYFTDGEGGRKSGIRNRRQRSVTPHRRTSTRHKVENEHRMDEIHDTQRSSERHVDRSRNDRNSREDQPTCGLYESPKTCATDHEAYSTITEQKQEQKLCSTRTTIEILKSRIQSTLKNAAAKPRPASTVTSAKISQKMQSNSFEEYRSTMSQTQNTVLNGNGIFTEESVQSSVQVNIDKSIFNRIVSTATSFAANDSNSNFQAIPDVDAMQFTRTDPYTNSIPSLQFPVVQPVNNQTLLDKIKDPRIRKMFQAPPTILYQHDPQQNPLGSDSTYPQLGSCRRPIETAPMTYGEYKQQKQLRNNSSGISGQAKVYKQIHTPKVTVPDFIPAPKVKASESSTTPKAKTPESFTTPIAKASESFTTPKAKTPESSTTPIAKASESSITPIAKASESSTTPKAKTPESSTTPIAKASESFTTPILKASIPTPNAKTLELEPSPEGILKAEQLMTRKKATKKQTVIHKKISNKKPLHKQLKQILKPKDTKLQKQTTEKQAVAHKKRKSKQKRKSITPENQLKISKQNHIQIQKEAVEAVHGKGEDHSSVMLHEQLSVRKLEQNLNSAVNERNNFSSSDQAFSALKEIVNPQHLLTLLDMVKQMTESNSLSQVREALKVCKTDEDTTAVGKCVQPNSTAIASADNPSQTKMKKNELDRLHEDIDNMFIRDGVLNASGRKRRCYKTNIQPSLSDAVDGKRKIGNKRSGAGKTVKRLKQKIPQTSQVVSLSQAPRNVRITYSDVSANTTTVNIKAIPSHGVSPIVLLTRQAPVMKNPRVKNNNPEWHSLKAVLPCQICYDPPGISLTSHYVNFHPDAEVLNSRLSPEAAKRLRSSTFIHQCETIRSPCVMYKQICYFCNADRSYSKCGWISHMIRHTGYYGHRCTVCLRMFSMRAQNHGCGTRNIERFHQPIFQQANVMAYVCELCNYVRFYEDEMKTHLNNEHEADEIKEFKEFVFVTLPTVGIGRPRKVQSMNEKFDGDASGEINKCDPDDF